MKRTSIEKYEKYMFLKKKWAESLREVETPDISSILIIPEHIRSSSLYSYYFRCKRLGLPFLLYDHVLNIYYQGFLGRQINTKKWDVKYNKYVRRRVNGLRVWFRRNSHRINEIIELRSVVLELKRKVSML